MHTMYPHYYYILGYIFFFRFRLARTLISSPSLPQAADRILLRKQKKNGKSKQSNFFCEPVTLTVEMKK